MVNYETLTWKQINCLAEQITIIPVGSIEQHSLHLPLNVDSFLAESIGKMLAEKINAIVTPTIVYGANSLSNSGGGKFFPGSVGLSGTVLIEYYKQILTQYLKNGARRILILNAHWENERFLIEAVEELNINEPIHIVVTSWWNVVSAKEMLSIFPSFCSWEVEHAGQAETALLLFLKPEWVKTFDSRVKNVSYNYNVYSSSPNLLLEENLGALSAYQHVDWKMGKDLFELVISNLIKMLKEVNLYE